MPDSVALEPDVAQPAIRVAVVDDHALVRATVRLVVGHASDLEWVGEAVDGSEAADLVARSRPDVVLMDLSMPEVDGFSATRDIIRSWPDTRVLVLTSSAEPDHVLLSLEAGAVGVLRKDGDIATILDGIRAAVKRTR
ncbi:MULTISPECIES: response regulator [unclassified Knoellia]|uniref:response regulator n=1 Tax=Knoellia altitudinis TaxID=3404795 RepID=UPI00361BECF1